MFKRILSCVLIMLMISANFVFAEEVELEAPVNVITGKYELLTILDIIPDAESDGFTEDKVVTRGELMMFFAKISGVGGISKSGYTGSFIDVNSETAYCTHIQAMENLGVITGNGMGSFNPESPVTLQDAITASVKLLGYDIYAEAMGGYPAGYYNVANQAGISKGVKADLNGYLSGENAVKFLFNVLTSELTVQTEWGNNDSIKVSKEESYLESVFDVFDGEGIIDANDMTGLTDPEKAVNEDSISVDGYVYKAPSMDRRAELGKKIEFYYRYNNTQYTTPEILYFEPDSSVEVITLDAKDIVKVDNYTVTYVTEKEEEEELKFSGKSDIIYNFKAYPGYTYSDIDIDMGKITLIDNDGNGSYDVLNVLSYEEYMIESINRVDRVITVDEKDQLGNNIQIAIPGDEDVEVYNGTAVSSFDELFTGVIINIVAPVDKEYMIIYSNGKTVTGTVTEINTAEKVTKVKVDETEYELSPLAKYIPEAGDYGTYYLNIFGQISVKDRVVTNEQYAYLLNKGQVKSHEERYYVRVLTEAGVEVYELAEKVVLNDNVKKPAGEVINDPKLMENGVFEVTKGKDDQGQDIDIQTPTCQQLIKFKTDNTGKLNMIKTFVDSTVNGEDYKRPKGDTTFSRDYKATSSLTYYGGNVRVFGTRFLVNADTKVFFAPSEYSADEKNFSAGLITKLESEKSYSMPEFYDVEYSNMIGVIVVRQAASGASKIQNDKANLVIGKVTQCYIPEEDSIGIKLYGYVWGKETELIIKDTSIVDDDESYGNGIGVLDLKAGDVIQYTSDDAGYIDAIRVLFQYDPENMDLRENSSATTRIYQGLHHGVAKLIYRDEKSIIINCTERPVQRIYERAFNVVTRTKFLRFDTKTQKLSLVQAGDIPEDATVYFRASYSMLYDIVYYD